MNQTKRNVVGFLFGILVGALFTTVCAVLIYWNFVIDKASPIIFEYGDTIEFDDIDLPVLDAESNYNLISYTSSSCASCITAIETVNRVADIWGSTLGTLRLWEDNIPMNVETVKYNHASLNGKYSISSVLPTYYIVNNSYEILYKDTSIDNVINKLLMLQIVPLASLRKSADNYIQSLCSSNSEGQLMVIFSMTGCPDCKNADEIINESNVLLNQFNIAKIYKYNETDSSKVKDDGAIFKGIYGITWYPSFLVYNVTGETIFIGEIPLDTLEQALLDAAK